MRRPDLGGAAALAWHEVRRRTRVAGALALAGLASAAVVAAYVLPGAASSRGGAALEGGAFALAVACALVAVGAGASHPDDRASGAAAWLAATGASAAARRLAPAAAAAGLAVAAGLVGGLLVAALAGGRGLAVPTQAVSPLPVTGAARLVAAGGAAPAARASIETGAAGGTWELDVRPVFRVADASARGTTRLAVTRDGARTEETVPVRGPSTFASGGAATVEALEPEIDLKVVAARRHDGAVPFAAQALLLGLLLGLAAATGAPLAALLSRGTSAPTATLAAALLVAVGAARDGMLELAAGAATVTGGAPAAAVLRGAVAVAPDLSALAAVGDAVAGRALSLASFAALAPAALHAAVTSLLLAALPAKGGLS